MTPPSLAARRFYSAFYQWTRIASVSRKRSHLAIRQTPRHGLRTSSVLRDEPDASAPSHKTGQKNDVFGSNQSKSTSSEPPDKSAISVEDVKRVLRAITHPVVLITSTQTPADEKSQRTRPQQYRGVTVSSFNTVSLDPEPVVSFNLRVPSRSWDAIRASNEICVHFLHASSIGAAAANAFTRFYEDPAQPFVDLKSAGAVLVESDDGSGTPLISWPEAVFATMRATLLPDKCVPVGDHVVVLASVTETAWAAPSESSASEGLTYRRQNYRSGHGIIEPADLRSLQSEAALENGAIYATSRPSDIPGARGLRQHYSTSPTSPQSGSFGSRAKIDEIKRQQRQDAASFSTCTSLHRKATFNYFSSELASRTSSSPEELVSSPAILKDTVADFLGIYTTDLVRPARIGMLVENQNTIAKAKRQIEHERRIGKLTVDEEDRFNNTIVSTEQATARVLARRAANDLRRMLDRGRVDVERARWLESAVEKGQALLLQDLQWARQARDGGSIDEKQFAILKEALDADMSVLQTESMRLKAIASDDENGDD